MVKDVKTIEVLNINFNRLIKLFSYLVKEIYSLNKDLHEDYLNMDLNEFNEIRWKLSLLLRYAKKDLKIEEEVMKEINEVEDRILPNTGVLITLHSRTNIISENAINDLRTIWEQEIKETKVDEYIKNIIFNIKVKVEDIFSRLKDYEEQKREIKEKSFEKIIVLIEEIVKIINMIIKEVIGDERYHKSVEGLIKETETILQEYKSKRNPKLIEEAVKELKEMEAVA